MSYLLVNLISLASVKPKSIAACALLKVDGALKLALVSSNICNRCASGERSVSISM